MRVRIIILAGSHFFSPEKSTFEKRGPNLNRQPSPEVTITALRLFSQHIPERRSTHGEMAPLMMSAES